MCNNNITTTATTTINTDSNWTKNSQGWTIIPQSAVLQPLPFDLDFQIKKIEKRTKELEMSLEFTKVEILCTDKVMRFTFKDNTVIKTICDEEDDFDFEFAFYIALAKKLYGKEYTPEGVFVKAKELSYQKKYVKLVKKGIKLYFKQLKEEEQKKKQEQEAKEIKRRRALKRKIKRAKAKEERIEEIKEGIKQSYKIENLI